MYGVHSSDLLQCTPFILIGQEKSESLKAAKYEIQKPSTCHATLFRCKFSSMFPVFHLARSTWPATETFVAGWRKLLRKVERGSTLSNKFWLCCSFFIKLTTCRATNLLVPLQINQSACRIYSTRNKCFCCGWSWSRQVKNGKHRRKLTTKQCCATSWGFLYLVFRTQISNPEFSRFGEIRDTKTINLSRNIVSLQVFVDVSRFSPCVINLSRNKNICCGLKKVVAKSRAPTYFEQQILALLLVFHQTSNFSRNKFARTLGNQPISAPHFFNPQQMFLLRVKLITQGEKRETSTKTCNETLLRDRLRVQNSESRVFPARSAVFLVRREREPSADRTGKTLGSRFVFTMVQSVD